MRLLTIVSVILLCLCGIMSTQAKTRMKRQCYDFVVPDDGPLQDAFACAMKRKDTSVRFRIFVKNGTYVLPQGALKHYRHTNGKKGADEVVNLEGDFPDPITYVSGENISLIGESRDGTIITNVIPDSAYFANPPWGDTSVYDGIGQGDVLQISGSDWYFQDITIKSGMMDKRGRNLAVHDKAVRTIYKNTCLWGYQDTWTSNNIGPYYFEGGQVRGRTDYMCGKGDAYFLGVELLQLAGGYAAVPSVPAKIGWVFKQCVITGADSGVDGHYTLGRPWGKGTPVALFIDTKMMVRPSSIGWNEMGGGWPRQYAEFNSFYKDGSAIDLTGRKTIFGDGHANQPVLTAEEAARVSDMKNMFGSWDPTQLTAQAEAPTGVKLKGNRLIWDSRDDVLCWAVCQNGRVVAFTTESSYTISDKNALYSVRAANDMGGLGNATVAQ